MSCGNKISSILKKNTVYVARVSPPPAFGESRLGNSSQAVRYPVTRVTCDAVVLRGTILNRDLRYTQETIYFAIFTDRFLVLLTLVPRNINSSRRWLRSKQASDEADAPPTRPAGENDEFFVCFCFPPSRVILGTYSSAYFSYIAPCGADWLLLLFLKLGGGLICCCCQRGGLLLLLYTAAVYAYVCCHSCQINAYCVFCHC